MTALEIKNFRKRNKLTQEQLAEIVKVKVRTVISWEQNQRNPPQSAIALMEMFEQNKSENEGAPIMRNEPFDNVGVPYYDVDFAGGWDSEELFTINKPSFFITSPEFRDAEFACNLFGKSVSNTIPDGSIVGFKSVSDWQTYFPNGEFYGVVTKNNLRTVKIARRIRGNDTELMLMPDPVDDLKDRFETEILPINFIIGFYQVVAWGQFKRITM